MHVKIGLSMLYCLGESFTKMTHRLVKAETTNIEIVDDGFHSLNIKRVVKLKSIGNSYGFKYSIHAPFANINIASLSKSMLKFTLKRLKKSIAYANILNGQVWTFHSGIKTGNSMSYPDMNWLQNCESVRFLLKIAEDYGVKIAIENGPTPYPYVMRTVEDFTKFYEENSEDIELVLDVGHANLSGQIEFFLKTFPNKIAHIHLSDNNGKSDQHLGIGYGKIDWQKFIETVKKITYDKIVVIESIKNIEESLQKVKQLLY